MSEEDKHFIKRYEELLDKGYCDCNEINCIDNNSPRRILEIVKTLEKQLQQKENIIKDIKAQLDYLETYSSKEDVLEDMKRRLDKIEKIIDKENK